MTTYFSLRRSLRKLPAFRSLSASELDNLVKRMIRKEYKPGDLLWQAETQPDCFGMIESGEILVEYRYRGSNVRTMRLGPGEFIEPGKLKGKRGLTIAYIRATADVALHVLPIKAADGSFSSWVRSKTALPSVLANWLQLFLQRVWWPTLVSALIVSLTWLDITRILSGTLFLASDRADDYGRQPMQLLGYAEQIDRDAFFAYNEQGYLLYQEGDVPNAETAFLEAVTRDKSNTPALNNLAATYFMQDKVRQAVDLQQHAVQSNPDHSVVQYNLGLLLMEQNANEDAIHAFNEASHIDPAWALPYLQKGFIYLKMKDYVPAEQAARATIQRDPTQESAHMILAVALYNQDQYANAQKAVEDVLRLNQNDTTARFYQAVLLGKLGDADSALMHLQELLRSTNDPQAISRIEAEIKSLSRSLQDRTP
jgi:tetratricopeptide (TPR) repeat protein